MCTRIVRHAPPFERAASWPAGLAGSTLSHATTRARRSPLARAELATLSGKLDGMDTAGGIDFDGDGTIDVSASKPGQLMKYSEFKPPGLRVETGVSMFQDPQCELKDYAPEANGIIPGYAGHIPRARDKYGGSAHNGCSVAIHGHKHIGPQIAHQKTEALGNRYGTDGLPLPPKAVEPRYNNYKEKVQGVMPGCARRTAASVT